jgi:hypothetical protein
MSIRIPIISEFDGKGIDRARKEFANLETAGQKAGFLVKKAFLPAVAVLGGMAVALTDATKAAMEDAAAQAQLALTLRNVTAASNEQIASVEKAISAMSMASGIADDELRPAFEALTRGTKDIAESTRQMTLVTDIATATGRPLVDVADALAKAYQGNFRTLRQLTPEMATLIKEGASLDQVMAVLGGTFGGATKAFAETAQGGFARLSVAINETKESIGAALLPLVEAALPILNRFAAWASNNPKAFLAIAAAISAVAASIVAVNIAMMANPFGLVAAGIAALVVGIVYLYNKFSWFRTGFNALMNGLITAVETFANNSINALNLVIKAMNYINPLEDIPSIPNITLPRLGSNGGGSAFPELAVDNRGSMGLNLPATSIPSLNVATGGGGGGGTGGGGTRVSVAPSASGGTSVPAYSPTFTAESFMAAHQGMFGVNEIEVNINGGLATSAEIGEAVVNSLRQYTQVNGPLDVAIA